MAEREELLAKAKEIQRQKLLTQARLIAASKAPQKSDLESRAEHMLQNQSEAETGGNTDLLSGLGRVLDYPGGWVRTGLAGAAAKAKNMGNVVNNEDLLLALKGQAPNSAEYMKRLGVGEGPSVNLPLVGNVTSRGVGGFAGDVLTDPTLYAGKLLKGAQVAGPALESLGESAYKSGFKNIDKKLIEKGKTPLSEILLENGAPAGTTKSIAGEMGNIAADTAAQRQGAYDVTDLLAGKISPEAHTFENATDELERMRRDPRARYQKLADDLEMQLNDLKKSGPQDIGTVSEWKTNSYDNLPDSAFGPMGKVRGPAKRFDRALGEDLRQTILEHGEKAAPGMGENIDKINNTWGSLLNSEKPTTAQINRGETINSFTPVDAALAMIHPTAEIAKKAADLAKTTWLRTHGGKAMMGVGSTGIPDAIMRRELIDETQDSPWTKMGGR